MERNLPNLRHLRMFRAVAESGSISQASKHVFLSQPAITQGIAKLEGILDTVLFERRSDGMAVTDAGEMFLQRAVRALHYVERGAREAARVGLKNRSTRTPELAQMLTTTQLRALAAVSNAKNFSLAARMIGIAQPSLHRSARDLERTLDISLFDKSSHGISLTRAGELLAQHAKLAFAEVRQGFAEIDELRGIDSGSIVVGTLPLARTFILPTAINRFMRGHSEIRVSVVDGPYAELLHGLQHGELDLLIGALRDPVPAQDVVQEPLFDDLLAVVARRDHPLDGGRSVSIDVLKRYPWVVPRRGTPTRDHFDRIMSAASSPGPSNVIESSSLILIRGLLLDSDRLTLISTHQIRHEQQMGLLTTLAVDMPAISRSIGLTLRHDWHPTAMQRDFLDHVRAAAEQASPRRSGP